MCLLEPREVNHPAAKGIKTRFCYNRYSLFLPSGVRARGCKQAQSGSGGTGRHTILRGWRRKAWGFKSPLPHQVLKGFSINRCSAVLITIIHVIVCAVLIVVVLLQHGKSADIAATFGGMGSQTAFGPRGTATVFSRLTTWCAIIFMLTSMALTYITSMRGSSSVMDRVPTPVETPKK